MRNASALLVSLAAIAAFQLASCFTACHLLIGLFLYCAFRLTELPTPRRAYYFGFAIGMACYSPHLLFFWRIFGAGSIALWYVLAFWLGLFVLIGQLCQSRLGPVIWALLAPFVWTGLEFFRSELYYLRFSWLSPGYMFTGPAELTIAGKWGVYGTGFLLMVWVAFLATIGKIHPRLAVGWVATLMVVSFSGLVPWRAAQGGSGVVHVVGVQLELPSEPLVKSALNGALKKFPQADVFVLSELTFQGPVPNSIREWCRTHHRWLIAGGKSPAPNSHYYNTAFVIDNQGTAAFRQAKCVPVQFMDDGLPARDQQVWNSPWGKIGIGICYDASYSRVTDGLIRQGAQALIFPTMDNDDWGSAEHKLHARIAPMRAAEYLVPVFRVCSSGISELVEPGGRIAATAPYPGQGAMLAGTLHLAESGRMPFDRWLARVAVIVTAAVIIAIFLAARKRVAPS